MFLKGTDNLVGFVLGKPDFSELEASEYEFCTTKVLVYKDDFIKFGHQNIIDRCLVLQEKSKNLIYKKYYFEKDNLGSIIGISNENGEIISSYEYDSFGNILNNSNPNIKNSRLFTSREFDEEIGFYYYRARYYDAKTGKFIERDPIDISDDVNLYVYVGNNPVNFVDPSGEKAKALVAPPKSPEEHYARNKLNTNLPKSPLEAMKEGWVLMPQEKSVYHSFNTPTFEFHDKYISPDGHREAVYHYETRELITDPKNMGTYNYYNPFTHPDEHLTYDVISYYEWGNSTDDPTTGSERLTQTIKFAPALINKNQENIKYKINSFNQQKFVNDFIFYINSK